MKNNELQNQLLAILKESKHGFSTRILCNKIFERIYPKYIARPGKNEMNRVYVALKSLEKQGTVQVVYPGYWKIKNTDSLEFRL